MSMKLNRLAEVGSTGLGAVVDHVDPKALAEKLDPRPIIGPIIERLDPQAIVEKFDPQAIVGKFDPQAIVEKFDPRAAIEKLDPRAQHRKSPTRRGRTLVFVLVAIAGVGVVAWWVARRQQSTPGTDGRDVGSETPQESAANESAPKEPAALRRQAQ